MDESVQKHFDREKESPQLDEASKLLLKAASIIEERGWCQHNLQSSDGRLCLEGAISFAYYGHAMGAFCDPATRVAFDRMAAATSKDREAPHHWNDDKGRTKEEVVAKLRAVALGG